MRKFSVMIIIIFAVTVFAVLSSCKVVKHSDLNKKGSDGEVTFYFESESFDAAAYVSENWETRVLPDIQNSAQPLSVLIEGLKNDFDTISAQYGIKKEDTSPYSFAVSEEVNIKEMHTESSAGIMMIDVPDLSEDGYCALQIGPVIKKSMVRDYLTFIKFGDFENQIEYANVSRELNFYIRDNVLNTINENYKAGATVSFTGVFTYDEKGSVLITPVKIDLIDGDK